MNIQINGDALDEEVVVNITNDHFNNFNFVNISWVEHIGENEEYREIDVSVEDLYRAIEMFNNIRKDNKE